MTCPVQGCVREYLHEGECDVPERDAAAPPAPPPVEPRCEHGGDWEDEAGNPIPCPFCDAAALRSALREIAEHPASCCTGECTNARAYREIARRVLAEGRGDRE